MKRAEGIKIIILEPYYLREMKVGMVTGQKGVMSICVRM